MKDWASSVADQQLNKTPPLVKRSYCMKSGAAAVPVQSIEHRGYGLTCTANITNGKKVHWPLSTTLVMSMPFM